MDRFQTKIDQLRRPLLKYIRKEISERPYGWAFQWKINGNFKWTKSIGFKQDVHLNNDGSVFIGFFRLGVLPRAYLKLLSENHDFAPERRLLTVLNRLSKELENSQSESGTLEDQYQIYREQAESLGWDVKTFDEWLDS